MRQIVTLLTAMLCCTASLWGQQAADSAWRDNVKTVQLYRSGAELEIPVLTLGAEGRLVLEFDVLGTEAENLHWHLSHCDRRWRRDGLEAHEFMTGFDEGTVEEHDFSFTTLQDYVHYRSVIPGDYAEFTHSGNYLLTVTSDEQGDTLLTRRFYVSEQAVKLRTEMVRPYEARDRRQEVDVQIKNEEPRGNSFTSVSLRPEYLNVVVQQNGRLDNRRELVFSGYDGDALAFRQRTENVFDGGNTFRFFDCSNLRTPMYNVLRVEEYGGEQFVLLRPEEDRSKKHFLNEKTLNGGMKANIWDRDNPRLEADYVWVNFSLPMAQPMLEGSVYIVGELTGWRLDSASRMDYNLAHKAYTKRLLLKQGYYAYQLLTAGGVRLFSATAPLEGDHWETPNTYTVFVYCREPNDRADRLVAVSRRRADQ